MNIAEMISYTPEGLEHLIALAGKLGSQEIFNVKVIGDKVIVVSPPSMKERTFYVGTFDLDRTWEFVPQRTWLTESVKEAGITQKIKWIHLRSLVLSVFANVWLVEKLDLPEEYQNYSSENDSTIRSYWTTELMMEYAVDYMKCWL